MVVQLHTAKDPKDIIIGSVTNAYLTNKGTWKSSLHQLRILRQQYMKRNGFSGDVTKKKYKEEQAKAIIAASFWRSHTRAAKEALTMVTDLYERL